MKGQRIIGLLGLCLAAAVLNGCSVLHGRGGEAERELHYRCGTLPLTVHQDNRQARVSMILDGKQLTLPQVRSGSGVRYSDGHYVFWSKGDRAFIERDDRIIINDCALESENGK